MRALDLNFVFFSRDLRVQGPRWALPGAGQKRAAGPKMARSPSIHVYTHRRNFLHFCRKRELDRNFGFFPGFAGPGAPPGAGQKRAAGSKMACTFSHRVYMHRPHFRHRCCTGEIDLTDFVLVLGIMDVHPCTSVYIHD
jgi:hypothetical protein